MRIFVHGSQDYLVRNKVEDLKRAFVQKFDASGMNLAEFPLPRQKLSISEVVTAVKSPPFLAERRMVVVEGILHLKKTESEEWIDGLAKVPDDVILVFVDAIAASKATKHHFFKEIAHKDDPIYVFEDLNSGALNVWARESAQKLKMSISPTLLTEICGLVGNDLSQLWLELHKLASYADGKEITKDMVTLFVHANFDDQMFALMDAVGAGQKSRALQLLDQQRLFGTADGQLFGMLMRQIRLLLAARLAIDESPTVSREILAKTLGIHPYVAQKTLQQAKNLTTEMLLQLHKQAMKDDQGLKTGRIGERLAVDGLVAGFLLR